MSYLDSDLGIPSYLNDELDIFDNSVLEIAEALAYKAHSGTYVEGLWDASLSTIVSMIPHPGTWQPLELRTHAGDLAHSYDPEVSEVPEYCRLSGNDPFFGYVSEAPTEFDKQSTKRSPLSELLDKYNRHPDLFTWALKADVRVEKLQSCEPEEYEKILAAGVELMKTKGGEEVLEGDDILAK
jgi:hypothetical protein